DLRGKCLLRLPLFCSFLDLLSFFEQHSEEPIVPCGETNSLLWRIAIKHDFQKSDSFQKLMSLVFDWPRPATESKGEEYCSLSLSALPATRVAFGDIICDAVECSPTHRPGNADSDYAETTECVRTKIFYNRQDTIIYLDVGCALKLADILFPSASQKIASILSQERADFQANGSKAALIQTQTGSPYSDLDFAYFTLCGASIPGIISAFSTAICEGIENSELRRWEKYHLFSDVTDCVTMQLWRSKPQHGLIKLRIGHYTGVNLANKLYAAPPSYTAS
ncbi:hypothetical protein N7461_004812, partial [Penicillium sp. DV-2018c]